LKKGKRKAARWARDRRVPPRFSCAYPVGLTGVEFIALNTDTQSLNSSAAHVTLQMGADVTRGLAAGVLAAAIVLALAAATDREVRGRVASLARRAGGVVRRSSR
jgi:Na+/proline symporter